MCGPDKTLRDITLGLRARIRGLTTARKEWDCHDRLEGNAGSLRNQNSQTWAVRLYLQMLHQGLADWVPRGRPNPG